MFDLREFRSALGSFMTGVTVVTTKGNDGINYGFTANSFTSVSLEPPLVLICPGRQLSTHDIFAKVDHFAINILSEGQETISTHFATFKGDRFADISWQADVNDCPVIDGATAHFSCKVYHRHPAGDHTILIGEVVEFKHEPIRGLGFVSGQYLNLGLERQAQTVGAGKQYAGVILEYQGQLFLPKNSPPICEINSGEHVRKKLALNINQYGLEARIGGIYSIYSKQKENAQYRFYLSHMEKEPKSLEGFVPLEVAAQSVESDYVIANMIKRYQKEATHRNFGLYIGDETRGQIHEVGEE